MTIPSSLLVDAQVLLLTIALTTPRALACLLILPGFGTRTLTGMARNAVAMAVALPAALPTFYAVQQTPPDFFLGIALVIKETAIGGLLGVMLALPIWTAQSIGSILDTQRLPLQIQANNASLDPDASAIGAMLLQAVVMIMIQAGLYVAMVRVIVESYGVWPAFSLMPPFETGQLEVVIKYFSNFFWNIIVYGGPVIIPLLLIDFGFAILGVFTPSLQVSFASSPIKSLVGLFVLLVYWPTFSHYVAGDFSHILDFIPDFFQAGAAASNTR